LEVIIHLLHSPKAYKRLNANGGLADTLLVSDEGKLLHIGHCADVVQAAAHLYDEAAVQLFGKEAQVNFPGEEGELQAQEQHQDDLHRALPAVQRLIRRDWVAVLAAAAHK
jgi:hypothetical protein